MNRIEISFLGNSPKRKEEIKNIKKELVILKDKWTIKSELIGQVSLYKITLIKEKEIMNNFELEKINNIISKYNNK